MKQFVSTFFRLFPESFVKDKLRCWIYNFGNNEFKMSYIDKLYVVSFGSFSLKFIENPYHLLIEQKQYFTHYKCSKGDVVIDAGGFWGTFAMYVSRIVGESGRVVVFEPDESNISILKENIRINEIKNIDIVNKGLWSSITQLKFSNSGTLGSSFIINKSSNEEQECFYVDVTTLDHIVKKLNLSKVDFIKMDIEGAEMEALIGAKELLIENDLKLAIASYHIVDGKTTSSRVEDILQLYNYTVFTETIHETVTYAFNKIHFNECFSNL